MVQVVRNVTDTAMVDSLGAHGGLRLSLLDTNYWLDGNVGTYSILVKDSTYGDFEIDNIVVGQNPDYRGCGSIPLTEHIKILVIKQTGLSKRRSVGRYVIDKEYGQGSC